MNPTETQKLKFDEYKLFVDDTARFSERRQTITNIYVTVNSILLAATGLLLNNTSLQNGFLPLVILAILIVGIFISVFWSQLIRKNKELIGFRINMLREIEDCEDMQWCHKMYHREDELYPRDENNQPISGVGLNFSDLEQRLPFIFIVVYVIFTIFLMFAWAYGML